MRETVTAKDAALERQVADLELRLLEKEAQVEELQSRLDDTRNEVVRTMAKLQTVASRAEAASGMAEAEIALQSLKSTAGQQAPEVAQATKLVRESSAEFNKENYGGALYLAGQAKALAGGSRRRIAGGNTGASRANETPFAAPLRLKSTGRGNVREGPSTKYDVAFSLDSGSSLTGHSYVDEWIRVSDESGRMGWIFRALVTRR
jgi:uncharacterized protein YgiM (DUF1202 family)